jgi:WD40 repeat protein/serine/threonine protein kinase/regulator of sirC expression with transglutaminase-like and TPR domain
MFDSIRLSADIARLPLPLAQTLRRALNAKSPQEAHTAAYYFFECALKLSASAQISAYVALGCPDAQLNELIENITRASTGHWLAILREVSSHLSKRADKALVPLADVSERLTKKEPRPAARAFLDFVAKMTEKPDGRKSLNCLDLFDAIVNYRNQELGHGAQRTRDFYAEAAPLIVEAALEAVNVLRPLGDLQLSVARDVIEPRTGRAQRMYQRLAGDGIQAPVTGVQPVDDDKTILAGRVVLAGGITRVILHPLVVYEVDELERDRVGFVNLVSAKRVAAGTQVLQRQKDGGIKRNTTQITVKKVEYLDYDSGARIEGQDATEELADLLTRLRGSRVTADSVDRLAGEPITQGGAAKAMLPKGDGTGEFIGDFEILEELGRGGMGIVYKARQGSLGRIVALKVLPPALAGDPVAVTRFKREIAALGRCDHANVVKVLHAGQDGERYFYAMEYVEGCDLSGVFGVMSQWKGQSGGKFREGHLLAALSSSMQLRKEPKSTPKTQQELDPDFEPLPEAPKAAPVMPEFKDGQYYYTLISKILADAARGVGHLHEHGIIHRDLKPANIMLTGDGKRAIVMDLGLAAVAGQKGLSVANSAARIVGTLRYMPPEQLQRHLLDITNKADIYSLGATLYELACLAPIFDGDTEARLIQQVLQELPVAPKKANPSVPDDLATIITVATSKNPNERYQSAEALAEDLEAFSRGDPISVRPPGPLHYLKLFYRRNRALVQTAAAAIVVLIALTAWFVVNLNEQRAEAVDARDQAEIARTEAVKQKGLAESAAKIAEEEKRKAEAEETKAREAEEVAKKERDNAEREKNRAVSMENEATRQRGFAEESAAKAKQAEREARIGYAESLVLQGDALMKANRFEPARYTYQEALAQARELGIETFPAESGLAVLRQNSPSESTLIPSQGFPNLEFAYVSRDGKFAALRHTRGLTVWDVDHWKAQFMISSGARRGAVTISSDDKWVAWSSAASSGTSCELIVNALVDGSELARFTLDASPYSIEFSNDGSRLALGMRDGGLFEYDWRKGQLLRTLAGTSGLLHNVRYSPDGKFIAAAGLDCKIWFFATETGKLEFTLAAHERHIFDFNFSPDSTRLVSAGAEADAIIWDLATRKQLRKLKLWGSSLMSAAFSLDGKRIVLGDFAGWGGIFDAETSKKLADFQLHHSSAIACAFSQDGQSVVSVGVDDGPRHFDLEGKVLHTVAGHHNVVNSMSLSADGRTAAAVGFGECVIIWDTMTGAEIRRFGSNLNGIVSLDTSADFHYALVWGHDGRATVWDINTGELIRTLPERKASISWASVSDDALTAALALEDGRIEIWSVNDLKLKATIPTAGYRADHVKISAAADRVAIVYRSWGACVFDITKPVPTQLNFIWGAYSCVCFIGSRSSQVALADSSHGATVWDLEPQKQLFSLNGHEGLISEIRSCTDGSKLITYSKDCTARVWDTADGSCVLVCPGPDSGVKACAISGDGQTVGLSGMDASLRFWSTREAVERRRFTGHWGIITCVEALPDGRFAVTGALDGDLRLWDLHTGACVRKISAHEALNGISALLLVRPDVCVTAGYDKRCKVWNLATGQCMGVFAGHTDAIYSLALMPDGKTVISAGADKRVLMWDWTNLRITSELMCEDAVMSVAYWPQLNLLYAALRDRRVKYMRFSDGVVGFDEGVYSTIVTSMKFSPDGNCFAVTGYGRTANVFSAIDGQQLLAIGGHTDIITGISWSPDTRFFITCGNDGTVRYWNMSDGKELRVIPHAKLRNGSACTTPDGKKLLICGGENYWYMWDFTRSALHESLPAEVRKAREEIQSGNAGGEALAVLCRWYAFRGEDARAHELLLRAEKAGAQFEPEFVFELCWRANDLDRAHLAFEALCLDAKFSDFAKTNLLHGLADAFQQRGLSHVSAYRYNEAISDYTHAIAIEPTALLYIQRGNALVGKLEYVKALDEFTLALVLEPQNKQALTARGDAYAALKQFDKALAEFIAVRDLEPAYAFRWQRVGEIRVETGDLKGADAEFSKAIEIWSDYEEARYWRGWVRLQLGRPNDALIDINRYVELLPDVERGWGLRGDIYRQLARWKEAIADYSEAIKLQPESFYYFEARADCRTRIGEYAGAVGDFRKALEYGAPKAEIYFNMSCAYCIWAGSLEKGTERWAIDKALESLEECVKAGYEDWESLKTDKDLEILRSEPRFLKLIEGK